MIWVQFTKSMKRQSMKRFTRESGQIVKGCPRRI